VRLFVATDLPPEASALLVRLDRPAAPGVRWTTPAQWHVTLRFLGQVAPEVLEGPGGLLAALDTVREGLAAAGALPVRAVLGPGPAWFPGRQVLQVPVAGLDALAGAVAAATEGFGVAADHPFRGHLTVARTRGGARGPAALAGGALSAAWEVAEVVLYSSVPQGREGPRYDPIHRVALEP
jgi:2'-5' RNA ligase